MDRRDENTSESKKNNGGNEDRGCMLFVDVVTYSVPLENSHSF